MRAYNCVLLVDIGTLIDQVLHLIHVALLGCLTKIGRTHLIYLSIYRYQSVSGITLVEWGCSCFLFLKFFCLASSRGPFCLTTSNRCREKIFCDGPTKKTVAAELLVPFCTEFPLPFSMGLQLSWLFGRMGVYSRGNMYDSCRDYGTISCFMIDSQLQLWFGTEATHCTVVLFKSVLVLLLLQHQWHENFGHGQNSLRVQLFKVVQRVLTIDESMWDTSDFSGWGTDQADVTLSTLLLGQR